MTGLEIFHTVIFILFGVVSLFEARSEKKAKRYVSLLIGVVSLTVATYAILVSGLGLSLF